MNLLEFAILNLASRLEKYHIHSFQFPNLFYAKFKELHTQANSSTVLPKLLKWVNL